MRMAVVRFYTQICMHLCVIDHVHVHCLGMNKSIHLARVYAESTMHAPFKQFL